MNYADNAEVFTALNSIVDELSKFLSTLPKPNEVKHEVKKEHENELLQLDQNLATDIATVEKRLDDTIVKLNDAINKKNLLETEINALTNTKFTLTEKLTELKAEREDIHKEWVASHPANKVEVKPMKISDIFRDYFWNEYQPDEDEDFEHAYWKFYSLVVGRSDCATIFGYDWDFDNIISTIEKSSGSDEVVEFLKFKHGSK